MNRFQHTNIDPSITTLQRALALTPAFALHNTKYPGRSPTGHDAYASKRLFARRRAFDAMRAIDKPGCTRPGSMNHKSK